MVQLSFLSIALLLSQLVVGQAPTNGLKLHYTFATQTAGTVPDVTGNTFDATLQGGATIGTSDGRNVLIIDGSGANFLEMNGGATQTGLSAGNLIATLDTAYCIETYVYVDNATDLTQFGNHIWNFANSLDQGGNGNGGMFMEPKRGRAAISPTNYANEQGVQCGYPFDKGRWVHIAYSQSGTVGKLYYDGNEVASGTITMLPNAMGITPYNSIGRPIYIGDFNLTNAKIADFRIYNRSLSQTEIENTAYPAELNTQIHALDLGDLSDVRSPLTLPATLGSNGVAVTWASNNTEAISNTGVVTRPDLYDAIVKLTATITYTEAGISYIRTKTFTATVPALNPPGELVAKWKFENTDIIYENDSLKLLDQSINKYAATLKNGAAIRTIGSATNGFYNTVYTGTGGGYVDLGQKVGIPIYSLSNYFVGGYYYIESDYTNLGSWGNLLWRFANSLTQDGGGGNGTMFGCLKYTGVIITATGWNGENGINLNVAPTLGTWHHLGYSQEGDSGRIFVDGLWKKSVKNTVIPAVALKLAGRTGTTFNELGRHTYGADAELGKTYIYGFEVRSVQKSQDDLTDPYGDFNVPGTIEKLNVAILENPNYQSPDLQAEYDALTLSGIKPVTANLTLPSKGATYPTVAIYWTSSRPDLVGSDGKLVKKPDYVDVNITFTATLLKDGQVLQKTFKGVVAQNPATSYAGDLVLHYDFATANVSGVTVTDAAEKHFTGTLVDASKKAVGIAKVETLDGTACGSGQYNVLSLTDSAYFDMGTEIGKVVYGLKDYSISLFYYIDPAKTNLGNNGNFFYTFSNSANSAVDRNGYMFGRASVNIHCVSSEYWAAGNEATPDLTAPTASVFHHFAFVQKDTVASAYVDGVRLAYDSTFYNLPSVALAKPNKVGTMFNWIGRPNFAGDRYLGPAKIADFKMYKKALTEAEVVAMHTEKTDGLTKAVGCVKAENAQVKKELIVLNNAPGELFIPYLTGKEKVAVYNVMGQRIRVINGKAAVKPGIYVIKVDNITIKRFIK
jgi:hypothetical protein